MTKMWEEIFEQPMVLEMCINNNRGIIKEIVSAVNERAIDNVVIAARGTSDHAGVYGKYIIEYQLGLPVSLAAPSVFTVYGRKMKLRNSLVIGISQSGMAQDVLEVIKAANAQGALTLGITNSIDSSLARESKYHLFTNAGLEKSVAATKTFTSQLILLAQLVSEWSKDKKMEDEIKLVPGNVSKVLELESSIMEKVQRYRYMDECFVLTRGINYSIALETALKIQETNYVRAKGYATSDFHHGPFAMVGKDMPVIIFAPKGPTLKDNKEMIEKLKSVEAEIIVVSDDPDVCSMGRISFMVPEASNDMFSPFYNVVFAQMFACQLALAKGLNPDSPRGLNKITITR